MLFHGNSLLLHRGLKSVLTIIRILIIMIIIRIRIIIFITIIIMFQGDHPVTAEAIAKKVNILRDYSLRHEIAEQTGEAPQEIEEDRIGAAVVSCKYLDSYTSEQWEVSLNF